MWADLAKPSKEHQEALLEKDESTQLGNRDGKMFFPFELSSLLAIEKPA